MTTKKKTAVKKAAPKRAPSKKAAAKKPTPASKKAAAPGKKVPPSRRKTISHIDRHFADMYHGGPDELRGNAKAVYLYLHPNVKERTAEVNGSTILRKTEVQKYLEGKAERIQKKTDITAEYVLTRSVEFLEMCLGERETPETISVDVPDESTGKMVKKETPVFLKKFHAAGAGKAIELIGKNKSVNAFSTEETDVPAREQFVRGFREAQAMAAAGKANADRSGG
jgi:hypothetical protein